MSKLKSSRFVKVLLLLALAGLIAAVFFLQNKKATSPAGQQKVLVNTVGESSPKQSNDFKTFTGQEFSDLYNSFAYPNTQKINEDSPITGNEAADKRIKKLAEAKGYRLRSAPVTDTFVEVQKGMLLQQRAARPWLDMKAGAKKDGISMSLVAAYRSAEDQRTIFLSRLASISVASIASGKADIQVNTVLEHTAVPGYSRHHTGYTVDIKCDSSPSVTFKSSTCFSWLSKNNYLNAKKYGWIPSYPDGAGSQGPEPEPWEFVWVGVESLVK